MISRYTMFGVVAVATMLPTLPASAQSRGINPNLGAGDNALADAILATPNRRTPIFPDNDLATTPGLEQPASTPQFTLNILTPALFNSNAQAVSAGGAKTLELNPSVHLGWAGQIPDLPIRVSGEASLETDRHLNAVDTEANYIRPAARAQYVNPNDDQDYSPFVSYASELDFNSAFSRNTYSDQNLNLGIDKVFNFDSDFNRVLARPNSAAETVWSFGFSATAQRRFSDQAPGSYAISFAPSAGYVISDEWNLSLSMLTTGRQYDTAVNLNRRTLALEPIGLLEYMVPQRWFGDAATAQALGNPAIDFVVGADREWSTISGGTYVQVTAGLVLKMGWRF